MSDDEFFRNAQTLKGNNISYQEFSYRKKGSHKLNYKITPKVYSSKRFLSFHSPEASKKLLLLKSLALSWTYPSKWFY